MVEAPHAAVIQQGGGFGGAGNIDANPVFVNPGAHDWRLGAGSPAVDAGNNSAVPGGVTTDLAGRPRFFDDPTVPDTGAGTPPIVDMGAYERIPLSVTNPSPVTACAGASASFSVTASGQPPLGYRWRKGGVNLSDGGSISGAGTAMLTINPAATGDAGSYDVVITDGFGQSATSAAAGLTVHALPSATVTAGASACASSTGNTASVPDAGAGATYSWGITNGTITSGAGTRSIVFTAGATGTVSLSVTVTDANGCSAPGSKNVTVSTLCLSFHTLAPCRVLDTRNPAGPLGGPALAANASRTFVLTGACGVPPTAKAVSINLTVTQPGVAGDLRVYPGGTTLPLVSAINYRAGQTRANNAVATLGSAGDLAVRCDQASGTVHFILDVNGWFE